MRRASGASDPWDNPVDPCAQSQPQCECAKGDTISAGPQTQFVQNEAKSPPRCQSERRAALLCALARSARRGKILRFQNFFGPKAPRPPRARHPMCKTKPTTSGGPA
jgi:hypothetical protein